MEVTPVLTLSGSAKKHTVPLGLPRRRTHMMQVTFGSNICLSRHNVTKCHGHDAQKSYQTINKVTFHLLFIEKCHGISCWKVRCSGIM